ncbi:MAG: hypothetical protein Kow00127_05440 [Bacteroidales bacterium]
MKNKRPITKKEEIKSFGHAFHGIFSVAGSEPHMQFHFVAFILVLAAGFIFGLSECEWLAILLVSGMVFVTEMINSAIEMLSDVITTDHHPGIGRAKDIAAGAVLVAAIISVITGVVIFLPRLIAWF